MQAAHVLVGQAELGPGDRPPPGSAADGDGHPISGPRAAIGGGDGVGVDEPGVAGLFDEIDSGGANVIGEPFAFIQIVFLAAGGADFINGTTIECDGGMLPGVLYDVGLKTITDLL